MGHMDQRLSTDVVDHRNGQYVPILDQEDPQLGKFDQPLPCFGCGIGWFSLLLGFVCPFMWYYATILYFGNYYRRDPRERSGLAASAIAALICTIAVLITVVVILLRSL
ncbi:large ribosomal subunit protein eL20z [Ziziphus jujuba]|uniref:60S ribosomal protein L18a-like protein n=1 Tax=Ziziphus jujuba TaxID=326968 RepID=A0A6P6G0J7_ZIZJJ|nr:large ribosomal subunit protein eL20z [Ziziphus jujuba]XP_024927588.1 large ribosomal subunit protein eL20z [Ziziphus jujuba]